MAEKPDAGVIVPSVRELIAVLLIILLPALGLLLLEPTRPRTVLSFVLISLAAAIVTFGFLGATGLVKTARWQLGGSASIFIITLGALLPQAKFTPSPLPKEFTILGVILIDEQTAAAGTKIWLLGQDHADRSVTLDESDQGEFSFKAIHGEPPESLEFNVVLPGYESVLVPIKYAHPERVRINLSRKQLTRQVQTSLMQPELDLRNDPDGVEQYGGVTVRPMIKLPFSSSHPGDVIERTRLRIAKSNGLSLTDVPRNAYDFNEPSPVTLGHWITTIDTAGLIDHFSGRTPHGRYQLLFELTGDISGVQPPGPLYFNYLYKETFEVIEKALTSTDSFHKIPGSDQGLEIVNTTDKKGFVSSRLTQEFDVRMTEFRVLGSFEVFPQKAKKGSTSSPEVVSLDLTFGDNLAGDLVSVILADGYWNAHSIKLRKEKLVDFDGEQGNRILNTKWIVRPDGEINRFRIEFLHANDPSQVWCKLYIGDDSHDWRNRQLRPVFDRSFSRSFLGDGFTRVRLKLWRRGKAHIYKLVIGEIAPAGDMRLAAQ